jgi:hypothetical protein
MGVSKFWKREHDPVEHALRAGRPEARDGLVEELATRFAPRGPTHRRSRAAFAGALAVFMVGSFASFGGMSYAAASAQDAVTSVSRIVTPAKQTKLETRATKSAAQDQYGDQTFTPPVAKPKPTVEVESDTTIQVASAGGELPFTGLGLGATALLGMAFLALGAFLRRRENRSS